MVGAAAHWHEAVQPSYHRATGLGAGQLPFFMMQHKLPACVSSAHLHRSQHLFHAYFQISPIAGRRPATQARMLALQPPRQDACATLAGFRALPALREARLFPDIPHRRPPARDASKDARATAPQARCLRYAGRVPGPASVKRGTSISRYPPLQAAGPRRKQGCSRYSPPSKMLALQFSCCIFPIFPPYLTL